MSSHIPDTIPVESIEVTADNGDDVANFLGARTYTRIRSRPVNYGSNEIFKMSNITFEIDFITTGYMMSLPTGKAIHVEVNKTLIRPGKQYYNSLFVGPQTGD